MIYRKRGIKIGEATPAQELSTMISYEKSDSTYLNGDPYVGVEDSTGDPRFDVARRNAPFLGEIVTRSTVWDYYRVATFMPNPSKILGKLNAGIEIFDDILVDARVKACLNNRRAGTLSLKYTIDQSDAPVRFFTLVQKIFEQWDVHEIVAELLYAPFYGYNVSEINWVAKDGLILPTAFQGKASRWFVFDDKNQLRFRTKAAMTQAEKCPPRKFIVTRYHPRYEDPYSGNESLASAVYWAVKFRRLIIEYAMTFGEKYASPWLDVTLKQGLQEERLNEIMEVLQKTFQNGIVAHPDDAEIKALTMSDSKSVDNYTKLLDVFDREIDMAILGNNLSTEVKGGSFAATNAHMDVRQDIIDEDKRMIEASFNQLIEWIAWYNFPSNVKLPKFKLFREEKADKATSDVDINLTQMGLKLKKSYFIRKYGLSEEEFEMGTPILPGSQMMLDANGQPIAPPIIKQESTKKPKISDVDAKSIQDAGIETKDLTSNLQTNVAVVRAQKKGYPYAEYTPKWKSLERKSLKR